MMMMAIYCLLCVSYYLLFTIVYYVTCAKNSTCILSLIFHSNRIMSCGYYPNSRNEETKSQERLCNLLRVICYYIMKPRVEPLFG